MAKRRTKRAAARETSKAQRAVDMKRPGGKSKYALKNSKRDRIRGWSTRETSPFYLPPSQRPGGEDAVAVEVEESR